MKLIFRGQLIYGLIRLREKHGGTHIIAVGTLRKKVIHG